MGKALRSLWRVKRWYLFREARVGVRRLMAEVFANLGVKAVAVDMAVK